MKKRLKRQLNKPRKRVRRLTIADFATGRHKTPGTWLRIVYGPD